MADRQDHREAGEGDDSTTEVAVRVAASVAAKAIGEIKTLMLERQA